MQTQGSPFDFSPHSVYDNRIIQKERLVFSAKLRPLSQLTDYPNKMRSINELFIAALPDDDESYRKIKYIMTHYSAKSLEIQFASKLQCGFIKPEQMQVLANGLIGNKTLKKLILSSCNISTDPRTIEILAKGISESNLDFLGIRDTPEFDVDLLLNALPTMGPFTQLYLERFKSQGSQLDRFVLKSNITKLYLKYIYLDSIGATSLVNMLRNTTKLELLELKHFNIRNENDEYSEICRAIAENRSLKTLSVAAYALQLDEDIKKLVAALKNHPTIDSLKIEDVYSEGVKYIAENLLTEKSTLKSLSINKLDYSDTPKSRDLILDLEHLQVFAEKLATNSSLKHLFLGKIMVRHGANEDAQILLAALKSNMTLLTLDIWPKSIISTKGIMELLKYNTALTQLVLRQIFVPDLTRF